MAGTQIRSHRAGRRWRHGVGAAAVLVVLLGVALQWSGAPDARAATPIFVEHFGKPGGLPAGWTGSGQVVSDTGYGPPGSLKVVDNSATVYVGARSPRFAVAGERHYDLSLYVHTDDVGNGGKIRALVEQYASTPSQAAGTRIALRWLDVPPSSTWRLNKLNFTTAGRARSVRISLFPADVGVDKRGRAWFDEVAVTPATAAVDKVVDSANRPVTVSSVVDDPRQLAPSEFWTKLPEAANDPATAARSLWSHPLLRRHFFATNLAKPRVAYNYHTGLPTRATTIGQAAPIEVVDPDAATCSARQRVKPGYERFIALDIRYRPIVSPHPYTSGCYTKTYFPRRTADHLGQLDSDTALLPAMTLTGNDPRLAGRAEELLQFLLFSQYTDSGDNPFTRTYYPAEFKAARDAGRTVQWKGGWDFNFNWVWPDGYGYPWQLHESDHHVNSHTASTLARAFEVTGNRAYLDAARRFIHHQFPRYGWHTGVWDGKRYYWSEYNPSGGGLPKLDATDNIQALGAYAIAMVGHHTGDRRMLEYARGLLWYCMRELTTDGRWYYDGGENPMNQRKAISHDMAVLLPLLGAVPYLLKSGVPLDREFDVLTRAYEFYVKDGKFAPFTRIAKGQLAKLAPEWDAAAGQWKVTSYYTANRAGTGLTVTDRLPVFSPPATVPATFELRVSKLAPPTGDDDDWTVDPAADKRITVTAAQLRAGVATGLNAAVGDAFRISYRLPGSGGSWTSASSGQVSYSAGGTTVMVPAIVPSPQFPTAVTDATFASIAAKLAFPRDSGEVNTTVRP